MDLSLPRSTQSLLGGMHYKSNFYPVSFLYNDLRSFSGSCPEMQNGLVLVRQMGEVPYLEFKYNISQQ